MTRVNNRKHLDLIGRSFTGNWTKEDKAEVEKGLEGFTGATIARDYFRANGYRRLKCSICVCDFFDRTGCNPDPVIPITEDGDMPVCCQTCNFLFVIPAR